MKTQFTKQERQDIYKKLLKEIKVPIQGEYFMCWKLWNKMGGDVNYFGSEFNSYQLIAEAFPEFDKEYNEMDGKDKGWNYTFEERKKLLKAIIK